jgi:hypothetical protein
MGGGVKHTIDGKEQRLGRQVSIIMQNEENMVWLGGRLATRVEEMMGSRVKVALPWKINFFPLGP